MNYTHNKNW